MNLEQIKEKFSEHVLTELLNTEKIKVYQFSKPGTSTYLQRWIIDGSTLIVQGDCFEAIYRWNGKISLKFLAGCNLGYFSEKCLADKDGYKQNCFEATEAEKIMKEIAVEHFYENHFLLQNDEITGWEDWSTEQRITYLESEIMQKVGIEQYEWPSYFYHERESEAYDFMNRKENQPLFGTDAWEYSLRLKTATPYFHLAALMVAQERYPDTF